jgi:hypothetical protein
MIRESNNLRIISASNQFRCTDVVNCKAAVYSNNEPKFERVKNVNIGCFFFMYTELPDLFHKADLSVWDNVWSEIVDFTPAYLGGNNNVVNKEKGIGDKDAGVSRDNNGKAKGDNKPNEFKGNSRVNIPEVN